MLFPWCFLVGGTHKPREFLYSNIHTVWQMFTTHVDCANLGNSAGDDGRSVVVVVVVKGNTVTVADSTDTLDSVVTAATMTTVRHNSDDDDDDDDIIVFYNNIVTAVQYTNKHVCSIYYVFYIAVTDYRAKKCPNHECLVVDKTSNTQHGERLGVYERRNRFGIDCVFGARIYR